MSMNNLQHTVLHSCHISCGGKMVNFNGWSMPIQYSQGIVHEHLKTRRASGIFDVSHMGRFAISGPGAIDFLQFTLTNNAKKLQPGFAHYTLIANEQGGAIDDAYLYCFGVNDYLLVVNAGNKIKDLNHLQTLQKNFSGVELLDLSDDLAMIALQGPASKSVLQQLDPNVQLPDDGRNHCIITDFLGCPIKISTTGYTGEPVCYELFVPCAKAPDIWQALNSHDQVTPVGLGARDTLRLEAALPLYGHEFGLDMHGNDIPILSCPTAAFAVDKTKAEDYIGKKPVQQQLMALDALKKKDYSLIETLPYRLRCVTLKEKGIAREHCPVEQNGSPVGYITSGTMVPYWIIDTSQTPPAFSDQSAMRSIGLALIDSRLPIGAEIQVIIRNRPVAAQICKTPVDNRSTSICLPVLLP